MILTKGRGVYESGVYVRLGFEQSAHRFAFRVPLFWETTISPPNHLNPAKTR